MFNKIKNNILIILVLSFLLAASEFLWEFYSCTLKPFTLIVRIPNLMVYNFILHIFLVGFLYSIVSAGLGILNIFIKRFPGINTFNLRKVTIVLVLSTFLFLQYWKSSAVLSAQIKYYLYFFVFVAISLFIGYINQRKISLLMKRIFYVYSGLLLLVSVGLVIWSVYFNIQRKPFNKDYTTELPNIIYIVVDTLRADALSCYGNKTITTSAIDHIASDGILFENAYSSSNWTVPGTTTLLTSQYPSSLDMFCPSPLPLEATLISEVLRKQRYATAAVVGNGLINEWADFDQGFDHFDCWTEEFYDSFVVVLLLDTIVKKYLRGQSIGIVVPAAMEFFPVVNFSGSNAGFIGFKLNNYRTADEITQNAMKLVEELSSSSFFLYLHYFDPHNPYLEHPYQFIPSMPPYKKNEKRRKELFDLYLGEVNYTDEQIGRLISKLKSMGLYKKTIIILTSDHGEQFLEHGSWTHNVNLYNEETMVPLIIKGIDNQKGVRYRYPMMIIDILPTVLDMIGVDIPESFEGKSLKSHVYNNTPVKNNYSLSMSIKGFFGKAPKYSFSLVDGNLKYIASFLMNEKNTKKLINEGQYNLKEKIYDLSVDKGEKNNIIGQKSEFLTKYREMAYKHIIKTKRLNYKGDIKKELGKDRIKVIRALGYIQ